MEFDLIHVEKFVWIQASRTQSQRGQCMPTAGDSGGPLYDSGRNLIGIAIAVEYGNNSVERAVYLSLSSKAFQNVLDEFVRRVASQLGF